MTHHNHDRDRGQQMGWGPPGDGYRVQSPSQRQARGPNDQGEYGGWASGEGQGEYGGQGYSYQGQFPGQRAPQYPSQGYDQDYGGQRVGWQQGYAGDERQRTPQGGWQQRSFGGQRFGDEGQFGGWHGPGHPGGYEPGWQDRTGGRGGGGYGAQGPWVGDESWPQGSGGGYWGQGAGAGQRSAEFHAEDQGSFGQGRFGGQGSGWESTGGTGYSAAGSWMAGPYSGRGPRGYQRSDARIEEDVCEALTHHGMLDATGIEVQVAGGEVTLTGTVESRQAKRMAEDIIESISGVRDIHNQLRVDRGVEHPIGQSGPMGQGNFVGDTTASAGAHQGRAQSERNEKQKTGATG